MSFDEITRRSWLTGAAAIAAQMGTQVGSVARAETGSDPLAWSLSQAAAALTRRTISSEELTKLCLARIGRLDGVLNSFITLDAESALNQARECDRRRKSAPVVRDTQLQLPLLHLDAQPYF